MQVLTPVVVPRPSASSLPRWPHFAAAAVVLGSWVILWSLVSVDWRVNAQYAFAWSIPPIAFALFFQLWVERPRAQALPPPVRFFAPGLILFVCLLHAPLHWLEEANQEWRMAYWIREALCILLTVATLGIAGGRRWVQHFAFPIFVTALAIPWPKPLENAIVQSLTRLVAQISVESLLWLGIPAAQSGNLIRLPDGVVGLAEACSGIRSLRTSLMLAVLFGHLYRMGAVRWLGLLAASVGVALVCNATRAASLAWVSAVYGPAEYTRWHDPVGWFETGLVIGLICLAAQMLRPKSAASTASPRPPVIEFLPAKPEDPLILAHRHCWPTWLLGSAVFLWVSTQIVTEWWYAEHERDLLQTTRWEMADPSPGDPRFPDFKVKEIAEQSIAMLRTEDGHAFTWREKPTWQMEAIFLRWPPGRSSAAAAMAHHPDVCLAASGFVYERELEPLPVVVKEVPLRLHHYLLTVEGHPAHVFYTVHEDRRSAIRDFEAFDRGISGRISAACLGHRGLGQQMLELLAVGEMPPDEIRAAMPGILDKVFVRQDPF